MKTQILIIIVMLPLGIFVGYYMKNVLPKTGIKEEPSKEIHYASSKEIRIYKKQCLLPPKVKLISANAYNSTVSLLTVDSNGIYTLYSILTGGNSIETTTYEIVETK